MAADPLHPREARPWPRGRPSVHPRWAR
jgi:hypothetical protein